MLPRTWVTANDVQDSESVNEIAAPRLDVPQHAPGQRTGEECGLEAGHTSGIQEGRATTLALTE
jgi:hypothetical protein